jgi:uncharacterized ferritin-like protein (DUF455 family)
VAALLHAIAHNAFNAIDRQLIRQRRAARKVEIFPDDIDPAASPGRAS